MTKPIKKFRAGNIESVLWFNEKIIEGNKVGFKTASLRRFWKDKDKDIWRDEVVNLRKQDITKAIIVLQKMQDELFLNDEKGEEDEEK